MKTQRFLINLIVISAVLSTIAAVYLTGERFGRFLYGLKAQTDMTFADVGYSIGYTLGYFSVPIAGMLLLYMAYRFLVKHNKSQA